MSAISFFGKYTYKQNIAKHWLSNLPEETILFLIREVKK